MRQGKSALAWARLLGLAAIAGLGKMALGLASLARQIVVDHGASGLIVQPGFPHRLEELVIAACVAMVIVAAALDRDKMDIHFAQGKMELGRFVCRKPA